ncbi:MAG: DegV family protein [Clostridia bacterium]|nr:DegV family protein [Clostridia bacterium]
MNKVKIITDSCSDLSGELLEKYNIDYCKMAIVEDGAESPAILTWSREDAHALYDKIRAGKRITTTQVPVEEFTTVFTKYLDEGYDVVYIGCSSKQSGSVNTGALVAKKLSASYPERKIFCIDSLNASLGIGLLAIEAAKLAMADMGAEEINGRICDIRKNVNQFVTVHTLDHLKKAGRVSATSAFFGNLIGVKPIIISDVNGVQTPIKKVKGRQTSFKEAVALLRDTMEGGEGQTVYIAHADCSDEEVAALTDLVKAEIPGADICTCIIGPIIGASVGPDAVGVWSLGKPVTHCCE